MKTEVRMALESIEEELQKTNACGYSAKIIRVVLEESTNSSHNSQCLKVVLLEQEIDALKAKLTQQQNMPFVKCDDHYCTECMSNHRN